MTYSRKKIWFLPKLTVFIRSSPKDIGEHTLMLCKVHTGSANSVVQANKAWNACTMTWQINCVICSADSPS